MLTKLFNSNSIFSFGILIILSIVLWAKAFINVPVLAEFVPSSPLYHLVINLVKDFPIITGVFTIFLIVFEAILINNILIENELIQRNSLIAAFVFIIINSFFVDLINFNPVLFAYLFIIIALRLVFRIYEDKDAYSTAFNIGTLLSVASMFYFPSFIFIIFLWVVFIVYRLYTWREWVIVFIGFVIPYVFLGTYYFLNDSLSSKFSFYKESIRFINLNDYSSNIHIKTVFIFLSLLMILSVFKLLSIINEKAIKTRKFLSVMIWFLIFDLICLNISRNYEVLGFLMMFISVSILLSLYLNFLKKAIIAEGVLIAILVLLIFGRLGLFDVFKI